MDIENGLPVAVHCPIRDVDETVFFHPVKIGGKWYISINSFNGCEIGFCGCAECEACKQKAYQIVMHRG